MTPLRVAGTTYVLFAYDIGFQVDLAHAERAVTEATRLRTVRQRRKSPTWFDFEPHPLLVRLATGADTIGGIPVRPDIDITVFDFGALLVTYRLPLDVDIEDLPALGASLYENEAFLHDSRRRADEVRQILGDAVERSRLRDVVEDYVIFAIERWPEDTTPEAILASHAATLARAIEAEPGPLSAHQSRRTLEGSMSYSPADLTIVDWNAAVLFDAEGEDIVTVLQHANVELLELRVLDRELDELLDHADETLSTLHGRRWFALKSLERIMERFAAAQTDTAVMFEGVNNAIKLFGNQYLARVYKLTSDRLDLSAWQRSVIRKLDAADSLYQKLSVAASTKRMEALEWVIIILITLSIILMFVPIAGH